MMRRYHQEANGRRSRQYPQLERSRPVASQPMPELPAPFVQASDCHWCIIHDEVTCTLFYDRQCGLWNIRFDWPGLTIGRCNEFGRDTPARQMQEEIIAAIDNRWPDDWMTENLPATNAPETVPGRYGLGKGVDY